MRQFVRTAQRTQHVGRFQAGRGAGRTARHGDVLDRHDQRLALDEIEADVEVVRHALLDVAVDVGFLDVHQALEQTVAQHADALVLDGHFLAREAEAFAHADDLVRRQRARAHAALMAAAVHLRLQPDARLAPHVERTDALGAVGLVRAEGHQVDLQLRKVDRHLAGGLRRIDVEHHALVAADLADLGQRLDYADFVVHRHHRGHHGVGPQRRLELLDGDQAVFLRRKVGRFEALAL